MPPQLGAAQGVVVLTGPGGKAPHTVPQNGAVLSSRRDAEYSCLGVGSGSVGGGRLGPLTARPLTLGCTRLLRYLGEGPQQSVATHDQLWGGEVSERGGMPPFTGLSIPV